MRIPNPIANTTTEAYLAYKAGVLEVGDLKPKLYFPYLHFDAWLAYWAGLVDTYPIHDLGKNLFDIDQYTNAWLRGGGSALSIEKVDSNTLRVTNKISQTNNFAFVPIPNTNAVLGKTITLSSQVKFGSGATTAKLVCYWMHSGGIISQIGSDATFNVDGNYSLTVNIPDSIPSGATNVGYGIYASGNNPAPAVGTYVDYSNLQVEIGSTATEYEPYTGTPETLTDEEALVAYLAGVTNTYPDTVKDPEDVRIAGYLRYLVSARFGCPAYPVNNRELYLSMLKPPVVTNETPSANIYLEDTIKAEFVSLEMFGDASQATYTGKNLFDVAHADMKLGAPSNPSATNRLQTGNLFPVTEGETYTLSAKSDSASKSIQLYIMAYDEEGRQVGYIPANAWQEIPITFTVPEGYAQIRIIYHYTDNSAMTIASVQEQQIEAGSSATSYEPYTGKKASPNPDYPQDIVTVSGSQLVELSGTNLLNANARYPVGTTVTLGGVEVTYGEDGIITLNGAMSGNTANVEIFGSNAALHIPIESGKSYTALIKVLDGSVTVGSGLFAYECRHDGDSSVYYRNEGYTGQTQLIPLDTSDTEFITRIRFYNSHTSEADKNTVFNNWKIQMAVYEGAGDLEYIPFDGGTYAVNLVKGRNLLEKKYTYGYINGSGAYGYTDVSILFDGYISVDPDTVYTFSSSAPDNFNLTVVEYGTGKIFIQRQLVSHMDHNTFTTSHTCRWVRLQTNYDNHAMSESLIAGINYQFERSGGASPYEEYTPLDLCKINNYQDHIYYENDRWYVHNEVKKLIFNGTETWTDTGGPGIGRKNYSAPDAVLGSVTSNPVLSDKYISRFASTSGSIFLSGTNHQIAIIEPNVTLADWPTWLMSNNVTVYYATTTPTDTQITNPALIAQLNALKHGGSKEGSTTLNIYPAGNNMTGLLKVEAGTESVS